MEQVLPEVARCRFPAVAADDKLLLSYYRGEWYLLLRQRYFFTAEIAENAENGELYCALLSESPVVYLPFPCFLPFSASSAASAVRSRVVGLVRCQDR